MFDRPANIFQERRRDKALEDLRGVYGRHYCGDNMFVANRNVHFFDDKKFQSCLKKHAQAEPYIGMAWRMHVLIWAMEQALQLEGDVMEFGTFRGFKMNFLLDYFGARLKKRRFYLFDTFEGIDPKQAEGSPISPAAHRKTGLYEFVRHRFSPYKNVTVVKGAAPGSLRQVRIERVAFLHLDMNSWQAETAVLERLWSKIPAGGMVVLDDFGLYSHRAQMEHELPWLKNKGCMPMELPTGQGVAIKHV